LRTIEESFRSKFPDSEIFFFSLDKKNLTPCRACDVCETTSGKCISRDDTNEIIAKVIEADVVLFGSPVYWWGVTAQMKTIIDKFYCFAGNRKKMKSKQIGIVTVGADGIEEKQYKLISDQYQCIFNYLDWNIVFNESVSAFNKGDVEKFIKLDSE